MIKMILATDEKGGIGLDGRLPWHIPEDLKYFKEQTEDSVVVMGRKSFQSLPFENGLPDRFNYVISNTGVDSGNFLSDEETKYRVVDFGKIEKYLKSNKKSYCIIGGASIYGQLFPYVEEIHHTCVKGVYQCDTFVDTSLWSDSLEWKLCESKMLCDNATVNIWRKC